MLQQTRTFTPKGTGNIFFFFLQLRRGTVRRQRRQQRTRGAGREGALRKPQNALRQSDRDRLAASSAQPAGSQRGHDQPQTDALLLLQHHPVSFPKLQQFPRHVRDFSSQVQFTQGAQTLAAKIGLGSVSICITCIRPNPHWTRGDATQCANTNGTFCCQWERPHWTQAISKELATSKFVCSRPVWIGPKIFCQNKRCAL